MELFLYIVGIYYLIIIAFAYYAVLRERSKIKHVSPEGIYNPYITAHKQMLAEKKAGKDKDYSNDIHSFYAIQDAKTNTAAQQQVNEQGFPPFPGDNDFFKNGFSGKFSPGTTTTFVNGKEIDPETGKPKN